MITPDDFYSVMCAMIPLYFAMLLAYAAVRWWKVFTPEQCSGINRFVAALAVPVLSFHFISLNNPYQMDLRFLLADTLSKLLVLALLSISVACRRRLGWLITLFSVATLPNTLVMGIPLLRAMYGPSTQPLMVQLVVLQCIIWYTLLLFLFEYRAATLLIKQQFPADVAAAIDKFEVDGDVISLDGRDPIHAESEVDADGRVHVRIRRSGASSVPTGSGLITPPRLSSISGVEIYSVNTPCASSDAYSLQPTPRGSNFNEMEAGTPVWGRSPDAAGDGVRIFRQLMSPVVTSEGQGGKNVGEDVNLSFRSTSKFVLRDGNHDEGMNERDGRGMPGALVMSRLILTMVGRKLCHNPNTYSSILGLLWSLISFKWGIDMPSSIKNSIKIISDAGLGMAMFSLGLFMALQPRVIACGAKMAALGMVIRFIAGPMIMSATSLAVGLRGVRLHIAIVQAALPQGIVPFVFAREYGLHPDILSTGVIFGAYEGRSQSSNKAEEEEEEEERASNARGSGNLISVGD